MYIPFSLRATGECAKHWVSFVPYCHTILGCLKRQSFFRSDSLPVFTQSKQSPTLVLKMFSFSFRSLSLMFKFWKRTHELQRLLPHRVAVGQHSSGADRDAFLLTVS